MTLISGMIESLLLGLSTGLFCAMYCVPPLVPMLCGRGEVTVRTTVTRTLWFLAGRFTTYAIMGALFARAGLIVSSFFDPVLASKLSVFGYIACALVLIADYRLFIQGKRTFRCGRCTAAVPSSAGDSASPFAAGLSVGLHICPAFWTMLFLCLQSGSVLSSTVFFAAFLVGTLPFFLPVLGLPFVVNRVALLRRVAQFAQLLVAGYFLIFAGLIPLFFYQ